MDKAGCAGLLRMSVAEELNKSNSPSLAPMSTILATDLAHMSLATVIGPQSHIIESYMVQVIHDIEPGLEGEPRIVDGFAAGVAEIIRTELPRALAAHYRQEHTQS
jgi:hypothetical protein